MAGTRSNHASGFPAICRRYPIVALLPLALLLTACSANPGLDPGTAVSGDQTRPRWPEPPLPARIEYVGVLASERDMGRKPAFVDTLDTFITGQAARESKLIQPMDVAVSNNGRRVFVSDLAAHKVYVFDLDRRTMEQVGGEERVWARPFGLGVDASDNLYVVEQENKTVTVVSPEGAIVWQFTNRLFERPTDVAVDRKRKRIYVVDGSRQKSANHVIRVFDLKGHLTESIGKGKGSGAGFLLFPTYIAIAPDGSIYVTDTVNSRVSVFDSRGAFTRHIGGRGDVLGRFDKPKGVALDREGNIYVADSGWSNVQIFDRRGQVALFFSNRGRAPGRMRNPTGLSIDRNGNIYVADYLNHRIDMYRIVGEAR